MPPRLTFIANASTPAVRTAAFPLDEGLDEFGLRDAAALAERFQGSPVVFTSPARRAIETAAALGLASNVEDTLRDLDVGRWAGRTLNDIASCEADALGRWLSDPGAAPHGGETIEELFARISVWLRAIFAGEDRIVAVTHPSVIRAAILAAIHAGPASYWNIDIAPLSVVELTSNGRRWALKSIRN